MTACIIAYRINGGPVQVVLGEDGQEAFEFPDQSAALDYAGANELFRSGQADYQIVELDEL